jgi:hypothetical protein
MGMHPQIFYLLLPWLLTEIVYAIKKRVRKIRSSKAGDDRPSKKQKKCQSTIGATAIDENPPTGSISIAQKKFNDVALAFEDKRFEAAVRRHVRGLEGKVYYHSVANRVLRELKEFGGRILRPHRKSRGMSPITAYTTMRDDDAKESEFVFVIRYHIELSQLFCELIIFCTGIAEIVERWHKKQIQDCSSITETSATAAPTQENTIKLSYKDEHYKEKLFVHFRKMTDKTNKEITDKIFMEFLCSRRGVKFAKYNKSTGEYFLVNETEARQSKWVYSPLF